jgi:Mn-dependent DtxR family transcriptional regulator
MSLIDNPQTAASCSLGTAFRANRRQLTETFSVKISKYEREGVETAAEEQDLLISEVIRIAIDHYLEEYNKTKRR